MAETTGEDKKLLHIPMNINTKNKGNIQKGESTINTIINSKVIVINFFNTKESRFWSSI